MALTKPIKPAGTWTYDDLFSLPDDGRRYEIIEGELYEMPAPSSAHAITATRLTVALYAVLSRLGGQLIAAPLDVFFAGANPVQPDIVGILPDGPARVVPRGVEGPPDLLVEVLSPSNRDHDELTKRALYGLAGVREYWIVDPEARTIEILTLDWDALHTTTVASGIDTLVSPLLGALDVTAESLFPVVETEH
jgi:Uma2 family endonuclease